MSRRAPRSAAQGCIHLCKDEVPDVRVVLVLAVRVQATGRAVDLQDVLLARALLHNGVDGQNVEATEHVCGSLRPAPPPLGDLDLLHDRCPRVSLPLARYAHPPECTAVLANALDSQVNLSTNEGLNHAMLLRHHHEHGAEVAHLVVIVDEHLASSCVRRAHLHDGGEGVAIHQGPVRGGEVRGHHGEPLLAQLPLQPVQLPLHQWPLAEEKDGLQGVHAREIAEEQAVQDVPPVEAGSLDLVPHQHKIWLHCLGVALLRLPGCACGRLPDLDTEA
mmetsp:Transcript_76115/g.226860  ORF Transcript_76115/g.226860 Transcript_76115/m.226860 type:complete len:276 (+) Transcript_76115:93-920(+)|eukprot:CAMPEP_0175225642 /NCGR_PEP_ID=MMETSP0093-20121207/22486_1 /TAXON_ID=311494 /ORGANISM="Alexandrium monilatum, Strain CCMP3105" /LENGTH=275 /DNA_ID=CAMNT_0016519349 /DNA_START=194 /DNA_END=1021 /DNA_ORIENTATION=+